MKRNLLLMTLLAVSLTMSGQGAKNIKINEVMTDNTSSIVDEYGKHLPWIELANTSFSTINVRGMYIATDKSVTDPSLTVPERVSKMSIIPNNETRTNLGARQHLILYLNSNPAEGSTHLVSTINAGQPVWIGLYEGNGVDLVDSVTIPPMEPNQSYARQKDGSDDWKVKPVDSVTPGIENFIQVTESKVAQIKRDDPHGFGITLLSMGIVFICLALLCIFFTLFGKFMKHQQEKNYSSEKAAHKERISAVSDDEDERAFPRMVVKNANGEDNDVYVAVISMALKEHFDNSHDHESGIITILPRENTKWTRT
ncbi:MAG: OadG family protein [Prevotella sp.]|nr:OadG family protein [Prevotella sp.]